MEEEKRVRAINLGNECVKLCEARSCGLLLKAALEQGNFLDFYSYRGSKRNPAENRW